MSENHQLLTIKESADYLRIHPDTAQRLARQGKIPARKIGGQWRVPREALCCSAGANPRQPR